MTFISPLASHNVGRSTGGGMLDSMAGALGTSGTAAGGAPQKPTDDGSVGLLDGIWKKALLGGAAGAGIGFVLPFGGPIIGGVLGALGGAAMGAFSNWRKMSQIKQENAATLAAMGVQAQDPQVAQIMQSGQVQQLIPLAQQEMQAQVAQQQVPQQQVPSQSPIPTQGPSQSPIPTQGPMPTGGGATNGSSSASVMEADQASATVATGASAQTAPSTDATPSAVTGASNGASITPEQLDLLIAQLDAQIAQLKILLEDERKNSSPVPAQ